MNDKINIKVNMHDNFSKCLDSKTLTVDNKALKNLESAMLHGTILCHFDKIAQIRYEWIIDEIELI